MKLAWGLITEKDSLWVQVLRKKYGVEKEIVSNMKLKSNPFPILARHLLGLASCYQWH